MSDISHEELIKHRKDSDFSDSCFSSEDGSDGKIRMGFCCPFCGEVYVSDQGSGSFDRSAETLAVRLKLNQHASRCPPYLKELEYRHRRATDPIFDRMEKIRYYVERGWQYRMPDELKVHLPEFWKRYQTKGKRAMPSRKLGSFKLALAQMQVVGGDLAGNLERAVQMISAAAKVGAQVVLLPEALDLGWANPSGRKLAEPVPDGRACRTYRDAARKLGLYVCAGLTERAGEAVYNAAVFISPKGELLLHHRKLYELEIGHDVYDQGDRLAVTHTPLATFGLIICADGYVPAQFVTRTLGLMGADVILSPTAWAVKPGYDNAKQPYGGIWRESYGAVARDFRLWIAGCSCVGRVDGGPWKGYSCIGCSLVVDPRGKPVLVGPYGRQAEKLLIIDVKPEARPARGTGWGSFWQRQSEVFGETAPAR